MWGSSASAMLSKEWIRGEDKHEMQWLFSRKSVLTFVADDFPFLYVLGVHGSNDLAISDTNKGIGTNAEPISHTPDRPCYRPLKRMCVSGIVDNG